MAFGGVNGAAIPLRLEPSRMRDALVAPRSTRDGLPVFRFDIRLQGENETVFLDM